MEFLADGKTYQKNKLAQPIQEEPKKLPKIPVIKKQELIRTRYDLLNLICGSTRSVKQQVAVYSTIIEMARYALNATASTMILFDEQKNCLAYRFSDGPLGRQLNKVTTREQLGLGSLVVQSGQSLNANAVDKDARFGRFKGEVAGVIVRAAVCVPLILAGKVVGIMEVINKLDGNDFTDHDLSIMEGIGGAATMTIENVRLNEAQLLLYRSRLQKLVVAKDPRELSDCRHARRVADYALIAARELNLPAEEQLIIERGAILHDIGMLGVPEEILTKKEKLTNEEWSVIHRHPVLGYDLFRGMAGLNQLGKIILYHHERFDGKGYPSGLKGDSIPLNAQIISVAEAFDSMTVSHSYREAMSPQQAMKELGQFAGTQFNPDAVKALCMGHIRHKSLDSIKAKPEPKKIDYFKNQHGESSTWKISFNQSSRVGGAPQTD